MGEMLQHAYIIEEMALEKRNQANPKNNTAKKQQNQELRKTHQSLNNERTSIMKIYGIKDKAMGFMNIFTAESNYAALRYFADAVNNTNKTLISEHAEDFALFCLGGFSQDTGTIDSCVEFLEEGLTLKK